jgi:hypothetical protein
MARNGREIAIYEYIFCLHEFCLRQNCHLFQRKIADVNMIRLDSNNKYSECIIICLGVVHKRRRPFRGERGQNCLEICRQIKVKMCRHGREGCQSIEKNC